MQYFFHTPRDQDRAFILLPPTMRAMNRLRKFLW